MSDDEKLALDALAAATRYYAARIDHLSDVLRALLDDDNEETRAAARRALEC
jgi:hypothetical protein